jgi:hypothetical protein
VLEAILAEHGNPVDAHRGRLLADIDDGTGVHHVVSALVRPMTALLANDRGRRYVRIVAQLTDLFPTWQEAPAGVDQTHLGRALTTLEAGSAGDGPLIRNARLVAMIQLMTSSLAARATTLEGGPAPTLDDRTYEANLTDMLVGVLTAPGGMAA